MHAVEADTLVRLHHRRLELSAKTADSEVHLKDQECGEDVPAFFLEKYSVVKVVVVSNGEL